MVEMKTSYELEEINEIFKMEDTIQDMLDKVMEEDDSLDSFDFKHDDIKEESLKISRISTRHQTSDFQINNKFNRPNKRNLTEVSNNNEPSSSFNSSFFSINSPKNASFCFPNKLNNYIISPKNPILDKNVSNNLIGLNNNPNPSIPSEIPFNHQFGGNPNINKSLERNVVPYSKIVVYNGQKNVFKNVFKDSNFLFNSNNFINKDSIQNIISEKNNISDTIFSLNSDLENIKRSDNRKKTYDIPVTLQNNIINYLKNNININNNSLNDYSSINNEEAQKDKQHKNKINRPVKDIFIYELKKILEKKGKLDYSIYCLIK